MVRDFLTPETLPATVMRRVLEIPVDPDFLAAFNGALLPLMESENWEQAGSITPEAAAAKATQIIMAMWDTETSVPPPAPAPLMAQAVTPIVDPLLKGLVKK